MWNPQEPKADLKLLVTSYTDTSGTNIHLQAAVISETYLVFYEPLGPNDLKTAPPCAVCTAAFKR